MILNSADIARLAFKESVFFDKEGFLFVRERQERLFSWRSDAFIERFCRLKGNLLFVLNRAENDTLPSSTVSSSASSSDDRFIVCVLVLQEYTIKLLDESSDKHFCFIVDFGKNDSVKPCLFASISSHERDSWVEAIHLSSYSYLRLIYQSFLKLQPSIEASDDCPSSSESAISDKSTVFTIGCNLVVYEYDNFEPNLFVNVYKRDEESSRWQAIGKTEIIASRNTSFAKQFHFLPPNEKSNYSLKFKVYDVIERLTETRMFLGEAVHYSAKAGETKNETRKDVTIYELNLVSSARDSKFVGKLLLNIRRRNSTNAVGNKTNCMRPQSLSVCNSSSPVTSDQKSLPSRNGDVNGYNEESPIMKEISTLKLRNCSVPNSLHPDNSPITPLTTTTIMSSPLILLTLDGNLFVNTVHRSFQFELPVKKSISVSELMAESTYCLVFPQTLMNIFMDDEKKLMNCVTYSLGEVNCEWQRPQMRVLESHLRLVNVVTESINELYQVQLQKKYFRPSTAKTELHMQFVPINFHLQRCIVTDSENIAVNGSHDESKYNVLDLYTVGAFASHHLGFEHGGLTINSNAKQSSHKEGDFSVDRVWKAMKNYFKICAICQQIEANVRKFMSMLKDEYSDQQTVLTTYESIDSKARSLLTVLDPKEVDETVLNLEMFRSALISNVSSNSMKRTDSMPLQSSLYEANHLLVKRQNSLPSDEQLEIEPLDLLHLNIKASLISFSGKIQKNSDFKEDFEPSRRKLSSAIEALQRMASICYAVQSMKLQREQLELFYLFRLRRDMIFTQALTSIVIAVLGECNTTAFQEQIVATKSVFVYFEGLLSCHADEIGMLQDMAFAVEEVNECVTFVFVNGGDDETLQHIIPRIEGNGFNVRVIIPVTSSTVIHGSVECQLVGLLFNVGINEHATLAETFGQVKTQDEINKSSFLKLETFITDVVNLEDRLLINDVTALKTELWSNRAKNVRVLQLMESITYQLKGIRFTSCKSAKDRTAMAATLEEVRQCSRLYGFSELNDIHLFQQMLDTLRSEGTRRENTRKNVGVAKYAFNTLRVMTLPKLYRPPPGTYGNVQT